MGHDKENVAEASEKKAGDDDDSDGGKPASDSRHNSAADTDNEDEDERNIQLGPQCSLREQLEKDKVALFS